MWVLLVFKGDLKLCLSIQSEWFTWLNVWHWLNILFKLPPTTNYFSLFFCAFLISSSPSTNTSLSLSVPLWMRGSVTTGSVYKVQRLIMAVERPLYIKITLFYSLLETYSNTNHIKHITYRTRLYATSRPSKTMQRMV